MSDPSSQPTQPLTSVELEAMRGRHELEWIEPPDRVIGDFDVPWCRECGEQHPCEVARLVAEADRLRAENTAQAEDFAAVLVALHEGNASDGYHTHNELYDYRMLYNAHAAHGWLAAGHRVVKSWKHSDGELCFGGGWFVVAAELPTGQVTNHYEAKHWGLFNVPEELPPAYDGHAPAEAADRLRRALGLDQDGRGQADADR